MAQNYQYQAAPNAWGQPNQNPAGAVPAKQEDEPDTNADPRTWDWSPVTVRDNLKRNNLERKCNDPFWAVALIVVVCSVIGFAIYGALKVDWKTPEDTGSTEFTFKGVVSKVLINILIAGAFGMVFAYIWSHLLKRWAGAMIKISIYTFIGLNVVLAIICVVAGAWWVSIGLGILVLIHLLWFWCVRHRIPMAEATLSIAVGRLHKYWSVTWISLGFSVLSILWWICIFLSNYGIYTLAGLIDEDGKMTRRLDKEGGEYWYHLFIEFPFLVAAFWGCIAISYIVHAICAGIMGTWYFNTSRGKTVTDSVVRACTTSLGSISFAAFIVAVIRALETMARQNEQKAREDGNCGAMMIALCIRCLLEMIGDILNYLNALAIIRVAVYGEPFCVAAKRTMNMMAYRGMKQIINDDLSGMPVWLGCFICSLVCAPFMYGCFTLCPWLLIATAGETSVTAMTWVFAFGFSVVALFIPACVLGTICSFTQTLYVLWGDDPLALDQEHPDEAKLLKAAAFRHYKYQVVYDDARLLAGPHQA